MIRTYEEYETGDPWSRSAIEANPYYQRELELISRQVSQRKWKTALDLGAGYGRASERLSVYTQNFILMDASKRMLSKTNQQLDVVTDINQPWPLRAASCELVVGLQIINHARDLSFFFRQLARILQEKGVAFLSIGNSRSYAQWKEDAAPSIDRNGFARRAISEVEAASLSSGLKSTVLGGSGLLSPHRRLFGFEQLNRWKCTAKLSHLVIMNFVHAK